MVGMLSENDTARVVNGVIRVPGAQSHGDLAQSHGSLKRRDLRGLMLGFAAFNEQEIRNGVLGLARALA
jgi:hypothetical protein